jgi:hypothetical protein|tara:strand:- start:537 stop:731 length:195 start_codon:yes stop_codon:yes gene_type:complete
MSEIKTYDGYIEILKEVTAIIKAEPLGELQKDSLLTKIEHLECVIGKTLFSGEEQEFQERRNDR